MSLLLDLRLIRKNNLFNKNTLKFFIAKTRSKLSKCLLQDLSKLFLLRLSVIQERMNKWVESDEKRMNTGKTSAHLFTENKDVKYHISEFASNYLILEEFLF